MPAAEYGRSLRGLTLNLLVRDLGRSLDFHREVLGAEVVYHDPDFAVVRAQGAEWMLHADHTYLDHPMGRRATVPGPRGLGIELRLHGRNPDVAQQAATRLGLDVLSPAADKAHGLRESFVVDPDGYTWVLDVHRAEADSTT
jgi:catechol 2,3-dioxygenase-like lactoylglutathione lyase family enzyme